MPKKLKRQNARGAPKLTEEKPGVPIYIPLVMEEREELAAILNKPVFIRAWNNAEIHRPPVFLTMADQEGRKGDNRAAKALCRIQGWELHKAALIKQTLEVARKTTVPPEEFPASASLEADIKRKLQSTTK